jgi:uncharacterized membrane protein
LSRFFGPGLIVVDEYIQLSGTRKLLAVSITALALVALGVSSYLTWVTWQQSTVAGCTGGSLADCDEVLSSSGSKWLGIPVSMLGAVTYAGILALAWPAVVRGGWWMTALLTLAMMAAGAGVWFIGNQAFVVKHFCLYCMTVHVCGFVICTLTILLLRATPQGASYDHMRSFFAAEDAAAAEMPGASPLQPVIAAGIASVGLAALIGGQMFFAPSGMEVVEDIPMQVVEGPTVEEVAPNGEATETVGPESTQVAEEEKEAAPETGSEPEPVEPEDEAVVATDESEDEAPLEVESPADVTSESSGQSFEQLFGEAPGETHLASQASTTVEVPRVFRFKYLKRDIDVGNNPVLGNPYAHSRLVEMLDYTCPHCRKLHPFIKKSVERYGDQLGFVIYHVPLSRKCNQLVKVDQTSHVNACDYARLAYGVWKLAPDKFADFHDWLMTGERAPPLHEAKSKAMALAGGNVLTDRSIEIESSRRVGEHAAELEPLKVGLPLLIFDAGIIKGMPDSEKEWFQMLEQRFGVRPAASALN